MQALRSHSFAFGTDARVTTTTTQASFPRHVGRHVPAAADHIKKDLQKCHFQFGTDKGQYQTTSGEALIEHPRAKSKACDHVKEALRHTSICFGTDERTTLSEGQANYVWHEPVDDSDCDIPE